MGVTENDGLHRRGGEGGGGQGLVGPFWCLREVLAPLLESVILLDRLLFLQEPPGVGAGAPAEDCTLVPLFDPKISPRNVALVALRTYRVSDIK